MARTIALILALIFITAGLVYIALSSKQPTLQPTTATPTPTPVAQTTLMLSPNPVQASASATQIAVTIDTGANMVTAVQLDLSYDPKAITNVQVTTPPPGESFFENPFVLPNATNNKTTGKLFYALGVPITSNGKKGTGTVAIITFTPLTRTGVTALSFDKETKVTAEGVTESVLKEARGTTILLSPVTPTQ